MPLAFPPLDEKDPVTTQFRMWCRSAVKSLVGKEEAELAEALLNAPDEVALRTCVAKRMEMKENAEKLVGEIVRFRMSQVKK
jgi:hypothetical protein